MAINDQHAQQELPRADAPVVEAGDQASNIWYTFFRSLWVKTGSGFTSTGTAVVLQQDSDGTIGAYMAQSGKRIGKVTTT